MHYRASERFIEEMNQPIKMFTVWCEFITPDGAIEMSRSNYLKSLDVTATANVGNTGAKMVKIELLPYNEITKNLDWFEYDVEKLRNSTVDIKISSQSGDTISWGQFNVKELSLAHDGGNHVLTCYDNVFEMQIPFEMDDGEYRMGDFISKIAQRFSLYVDEPVILYANSVAIVDSRVYNAGFTFRDALDDCCELIGSTAVVEGTELVFKLVIAGPYQITSTNMLSFVVGDFVEPIHKVTISKLPIQEFVTRVTPGVENPNEWSIDNNQIALYDPESLIDHVYDFYQGLSFHIGDVELSTLLYVNIGDFIELTHNGVNRTIFVNELSIKLGSNNQELVRSTQKAHWDSNYAISGVLDRRVERTEIVVDKQRNQIQSIIQLIEGNDEKLTELLQTLENFQFKVEASGGMNLIRNSVGWAGDKFWRSLANGSLANVEFQTMQSVDISNNSMSKSAISFGTRETYLAYCRNDFETIPGHTYSVRCKVKKGIGFNQVLIYDDTYKTLLLLFQDIRTSMADEWEEYSGTFVARSNISAFLIYNYTSSSLYPSTNIMVTDIMVVEGELPSRWSPAPQEIYGMNVVIDGDGILIKNPNSGTEVRITNEEFAIYSGGTKALTVNEDLTIVSAIHIKDSLQIGNNFIQARANGTDEIIK